MYEINTEHLGQLQGIKRNENTVFNCILKVNMLTSGIINVKQELYRIQRRSKTLSPWLLSLLFYGAMGNRCGQDRVRDCQKLQSSFSPFLLIEFTGVTLINKITRVSGAQFHNTSSVHCTMCSPPQV